MKQVNKKYFDNSKKVTNNAFESLEEYDKFLTDLTQKRGGVKPIIFYIHSHNDIKYVTFKHMVRTMPALNIGGEQNLYKFWFKYNPVYKTYTCRLSDINKLGVDLVKKHFQSQKKTYVRYAFMNSEFIHELNNLQFERVRKFIEDNNY